MTIQLYVATDSLDGTKSYFIFDTSNPGRYICGTYSTAMLAYGSEESLIAAMKEEVKNNLWDCFGDEDRRNCMVDGMLIAEWGNY